MNTFALEQPVTITIGTLSRSLLLEALQNAGVGLNPSATVLFDNSVFNRPAPQTLSVITRSVGELGFADGATLPQIFDAAREGGLLFCPATLAPYLRLEFVDQQTAPDTVLSNGRAPSGSLTVASVPLSADPAYPKGFYLRVIGGRPWLRGYSCDDEHVWDPGDRFLFRASR